jgi:DNA (cytosine-5)-methyltransferase 1
VLDPDRDNESRPLAVGLFAGIGGIERGLDRAGFSTALLCEYDSAATTVLRQRFPESVLHDDIRTLDELPAARVVSAGFPCQDLSQAGRTAGISGSQSGLVEHVFRLLDGAAEETEWLLLENVPFMLSLERGEAMRYLVEQLTSRGWNWAYRVVDTRAFGLPHRRLRVILLASKSSDPRAALFNRSVVPREVTFEEGAWCGFYWTEGLRGLGWAVEAVPTLKGGSTVGIPSPPGVWNSATGEIGTPDIRDAERLQGLPANWTLPAIEDVERRNTPRWRLVGNAVSVPVSRWVGERLLTENGSWSGDSVRLEVGDSWPGAAWGNASGAYLAKGVTPWPKALFYRPLSGFLKYDLQPLSRRAASGFLGRTYKGTLKTFVPGFRQAVAAHVDAMAELQAA